MISVTLSEEQIKQQANDADLGALVRQKLYEEKENILKMIDPPSGWMYGFPKPIPHEEKNVLKWLVDNGYPQREIDKLEDQFMCRYWYQPKKSDDGTV